MISLPKSCDSLCRYRDCFSFGELDGKNVCLKKEIQGCPKGKINGKPVPSFLVEKIRKEMKDLKYKADERPEIEFIIDIIEILFNSIFKSNGISWKIITPDVIKKMEKSILPIDSKDGKFFSNELIEIVKLILESVEKV